MKGSRTVRRAGTGAIVHAASWLGTSWIITYLTSGSAASLAYGALSGWWCALYVGAIAGVRIHSTAVAAAIYLSCALSARLLGWSWPLSNADRTWGAASFALDVGSALLFVTPIVINEVVMRLVRGPCSNGLRG